MRPDRLLESQRELDDLFGRMLGRSAPDWPVGGYSVPTDVFRTENSLVVRLDLPGVNPDDVDVTVQENVLLINGRRDFPRDTEELHFLQRGTFYGEFTQRLSLGRGLEVDKIRARFDNGVLELSIPYSESVQPKKISIAVGDREALPE